MRRGSGFAFGIAALVASVALVGLATVGLAAAGPEPGAGAEIYARCQACHALEYDRIGPRHCGLFGRPAGSVPGFPYSDAMRRSGIVWSRESLDAFLEDPLGVVPGTTMTYAGIPDPVERDQLIAWLELAASRGRCAAPVRSRAQAPESPARAEREPGTAR